MCFDSDFEWPQITIFVTPMYDDDATPIVIFYSKSYIRLSNDMPFAFVSALDKVPQIKMFCSKFAVR